jgi:hypothetical protein
MCLVFILGMILQYCWRGFSSALLGAFYGTLEQVVFLPAIQQHQQEG